MRPVSPAVAPASGAAGHHREVPEVTFCTHGLERIAGAAQAGAMNERLKVLLSPLNFAAYLAWDFLAPRIRLARARRNIVQRARREATRNTGAVE